MTLRTHIMGIDPGKTGAIALLDTRNNRITDMYDIPLVKDKHGKLQLDHYNCASLIDVHAPTLKYCIIEDVHSMPEQGVVAVFSFGQVYGLLLGMLASSLITIQKVRPAVWKCDLALSHDKKESIALAKKLFPEDAHFFNSKDGRAEAALIAHFGRKHIK